MNDINYRETVKKLHDAGWKNSYFTSADVYMLGYGCGVSKYTQYYVKYLDMYQMLPHPHIGSFDVFTGDNSIKKMGARLGKSSRNIFWEYIETRITIDDIEKGIRSQYWKTLKEKLTRQNK